MLFTPDDRGHIFVKYQIPLRHNLPSLFPWMISYESFLFELASASTAATRDTTSPILAFSYTEALQQYHGITGALSLTSDTCIDTWVEQNHNQTLESPEVCSIVLIHET